MATARVRRLAGALRQSYSADQLADRPDAELLARFAAGDDPAAFEAVVRRHAPIVLAACRKALSDPADVDDAFQATFLVLLRRPPAAGSPAPRPGRRRPRPRTCRGPSPRSTPNSTGSPTSSGCRYCCVTSKGCPATRRRRGWGGRSGR
jgi:hypothetical protein